MSDQTAARHSALTLAVQLATPQQTALDVILNAQAFLGFLSGAETAAAPAAKPAAKPAAPAKASRATGTKPTPTKTVSKPVEAEPETTEAEGPTAQDVGAKINELLAADKQDEALAALKKYGAKSKSTLKEEHYADFLADAETILLSA